MMEGVATGLDAGTDSNEGTPRVVDLGAFVRVQLDGLKDKDTNADTDADTDAEEIVRWRSFSFVDV
jgi:hypothetical protein